MKKHAANSDKPSYIGMYSNDLRFMAADASHWQNKEEGGSLYGLWTHGGKPVIMLATPSGPGATNETSHFAQDPSYVFEVSRLLQQKFGIQCLGSWHNHHSLGLSCPSAGDVEQAHRFAARSRIDRMVQIIVSYDRGISPFCSVKWPFRHNFLDKIRNIKDCDCKKNTARDNLGLIQIKAFFYPDAQKGSYQQYPVNILSEKNPIRQALAESHILHTPYPLDLEKFPIEKIAFNKAKFPTWQQETLPQVPDFILEQLAGLNANIAKDADIDLEDKQITINLPLCDGQNLSVVYNTEESETTIKAVNLCQQKPPEVTDITDTVLASGDMLSLNEIYHKVSVTMTGYKYGRPLSFCPPFKLIGLDDEDIQAHSFSVKAENIDNQEVKGESKNEL